VPKTPLLVAGTGWYVSTTSVGSPVEVGRSRGVVFSFLYWTLRPLLELLVLRLRSERAKEIEILVLRHQLQLLERQVTRGQLLPADRALLAAFRRVLPRRAWSTFSVRRPRTCAATARSRRGNQRLHARRGRQADQRASRGRVRPGGAVHRARRERDVRGRRRDGRGARRDVRVRPAGGTAEGDRDGTVLAIGATPGEAYQALDWGEAWPFHSASMTAYGEQRYALSKRSAVASSTA
jgi:hypothetical protein